MKLATGLATCIFFCFLLSCFFCVWFMVVGGVNGMLGLCIKKNPHRQLLSFLVRDSEPGMTESDETPRKKEKKKTFQISKRVNLALV